MRPLAAIFLLTVFASALLRPVVPYLEYWTNYDYIAEVLCINQDKPEMQCNGQCHLSQQLEKAADQSDEPGTPPSSNRQQVELSPVIIGEVQSLSIRAAIGSPIPNYPAAALDRSVPPPTPPPRFC